MNINISDEMAQAIVSALRLHIKTNGTQDFGPKGGYQVSNEEALEFFETLLNGEAALVDGFLVRVAREAALDELVKIAQENDMGYSK